MQLIARFLYTTNKDNNCLTFYVGNDINVVKKFPNEKIENHAKIVNTELFIRNCNYKKDLHKKTNILGKTKRHVKIIDIENLKNKRNIFNNINNEDYIIFVDKRSHVEPEYIQSLQKLQSDANLMISGYNIYYKTNFIARLRRTEGCIPHENKDYALYSICFKAKFIRNCISFNDVWNKLINASIDDADYIDIEGYNINLVQNKNSLTKVLPFYLPQYHECEENNKWWGKGFTEWDNVKRAVPQYKNHNQPRVPDKLGYYDLDKISTQKAQISIASKYNVHGFCYYYYWFAGKKVLDKPLSRLMENKDLNFPFCLCWANESWTRSWDGLNKDILLKQVHNEETDVKFIYSILPMLKDPRYIKINGCPLLLIYRISLFENPKKTINTWRKVCKDNGIDNIKIGLVKSFNCVENKHYDADYAVEFPPHNLFQEPISNDLVSINKNFSGGIFDYERLVNHQEVIQYRGYNCLAGTMLQWDNTARRMDKSDSWVNFSIPLYRKWLIRNQIYTLIYEPSKIMFFNAWNEWAEGTYLEPDKKYGTQFLEVIKEVTRLY